MPSKSRKYGLLLLGGDGVRRRRLLLVPTSIKSLVTRLGEGRLPGEGVRARRPRRLVGGVGGLLAGGVGGRTGRLNAFSFLQFGQVHGWLGVLAHHVRIQCSWYLYLQPLHFLGFSPATKSSKQIGQSGLFGDSRTPPTTRRRILRAELLLLLVLFFNEYTPIKYIYYWTYIC